MAIPVTLIGIRQSELMQLLALTQNHPPKATKSENKSTHHRVEKVGELVNLYGFLWICMDSYGFMLIFSIQVGIG